MKNKYLLMILLCLTGCYSVSRVVVRDLQNIPRDKRYLVAVIDFENKTGDESNDILVKSIYGNTITALTDTGRFRIIERMHLESVLKELNLQMTGITDPANSKKLGKMLGADAILLGELASVKYSSNKQSIFIAWTEGKKTDLTINGRLVSVETGELLASVSATAFVKQRRWVAFWIARLGKKMDKNSIISTAMDIASKQLANDIAYKAYR